MRETDQDLLSLAEKKGKWARFNIDSISYIMHQELIGKLRQEGTLPSNVDPYFTTRTTSGIFIMLTDFSSHGFLNIGEYTEDNPEKDLLTILGKSPYTDLQNIQGSQIQGSSIDFYTIDSERSHWSIHCKRNR